MDVLYIIDIVGTMVFAISGAVTAFEKKLDIFGVSTVAFITALGGGTIRDILIGSTPVGWMNNLTYLGVIGAGILIAIFFKNIVERLRRTFFLFDTIGIAVFTVLGIEKSLSIGIHPIIAIMMGVISAAFGGVTRDIICNEIPLIFRKEIYALTCLAGGVLYMMLLHFSPLSPNWIVMVTVGFIAGLRMAVVRFGWTLPSIS